MGTQPLRLTRPYVGFRPTMPLPADGVRTEPPVSVPMAANNDRAATAAPDPALEPPGYESSCQGLRVSGTFWPYANSWVTVLPTTIAPASRSLRTTVASCVGTNPVSTREPASVGMSLVYRRSLTPTGMPCSGPFANPFTRDSSALRAA